MSGAEWIAHWWVERYRMAYRRRSLWRKQGAIALALLDLCAERDKSAHL